MPLLRRRRRRSIPGRFTYGSFLQQGRRVFWDERHPEKAIRIDLDHEHDDELIVEVENPDEVIRLLTAKNQREGPRV